MRSVAAVVGVVLLLLLGGSTGFAARVTAGDTPVYSPAELPEATVGQQYKVIFGITLASDPVAGVEAPFNGTAPPAPGLLWRNIHVGDHFVLAIIGKPTKVGKFKIAVQGESQGYNVGTHTWTLVVNGSVAGYQVESFQINDVSKSSRSSALDSKIAAKKDELAKVFAFGALESAYISHESGADAAAKAADAKEFDFERAVDEIGTLQTKGASKAAVAAQVAKAEVLQKAVRNLRALASGALKEAQVAGTAYIDADSADYPLEQELIALLEEKRKVDAGSSVDKVEVKADGATVFTAAFDQASAQQLADIDALRRSLATQVEAAKRVVETYKTKTIAAIHVAQKRADDAANAVMQRGWVRFGNSIFAGGFETLQGFAEAGPFGAFVSLATHVVKEKAFEETADDLELQQAVEQQLNAGNSVPTSSWGVEGAEADKMAVGATVEGLKGVVEIASESPVVEEAIKGIFTANYGASNPGISAVKSYAAKSASGLKKAKTLAEVFEKLAGAEAGSLLVEGGAKLGVSVAVEAGLHQFDELYKEKVVKAWADFVLADRAVHGMLAAFHGLAVTEKKLSLALTDLEQSEERFLSKQANAAGYKVTLTSTFKDDAHIVVTTTPPLKAFGKAEGELGGLQLVQHGNALTGTAKDLESTGQSPRKVGFALTVGK